jgi:hypothetical protein
VIHYDLMMGYSPRWRGAITEALKGRPISLKAEVANLDRRGVGVSARMLMASYAYAHSGQQVYCVGPRLQTLFCETEVSSVPEEFLQLPYECFYIALPACGFPLWGGTTGWHEVSGLYVGRYGDRLMLLAWAQANERSVHASDDASFWLSLDLEKVPEGRCEGSKNLEKGIEAVLMQADHSDVGMSVSDPDVKRKTQETLQRLLRVCINLLLYLNSLEPELVDEPRISQAERQRLKRQAQKKGKKARRAARKLDLSTEAKVVWVGKSIEGERAGTLGVGTSRVVAPHWRKGHFHAYWVGPRRDQEGNVQKGTHRVSRWVRPVYVGDLASVVGARGRIHHFKEDHE